MTRNGDFEDYQTAHYLDVLERIATALERVAHVLELTYDGRK